MRTHLNDDPRGLKPATCLFRSLTVASLIVAVGAARASAGGENYTVIKAGRVITISGEEFSPGIIVLEDDKISAVGKGIEYPPSAKVIEDRKSTRLNSSHIQKSRMPSSA